MGKLNLHKLYAHAGLVTPYYPRRVACTPEFLTLPKIRKAIQHYYNEIGKTPYRRSGDALKWFGFPVTWKTVDYWLRKSSLGETTLFRLCIKMELRDSTIKLTIPLIKKAVRAYYKEKGKPPLQSSGDATNWFGFRTSWHAVDSRLKRGLQGHPKITLSRFCVAALMKPPVPT